MKVTLVNHPRPELSKLMRCYHRARKAIKAGKLNPTLDRLNKGLGLAMRKEYARPYQTTINACTCPDHARHPGQWCKHQLALALIVRATE